MMQKEIIFLLEEQSVIPIVKKVAATVVPQEVRCIFSPYGGWPELRESVSKRIKGWQNPNASFLVLVDKDSADCKDRKDVFLDEINPHLRGRLAFVRIACVEMEAWFWGDPDAVGLSGLEKSPRSVKKARRRAKYRKTDAIGHPAEELGRFLKEEFRQSKGKVAETIAPHMNLDHNDSPSFNAFVDAVKRLAA